MLRRLVSTDAGCSTKIGSSGMSLGKALVEAASIVSLCLVGDGCVSSSAGHLVSSTLFCHTLLTYFEYVKSPTSLQIYSSSCWLYSSYPFFPKLWSFFYPTIHHQMFLNYHFYQLRSPFSPQPQITGLQDLTGWGQSTMLASISVWWATRLAMGERGENWEDG